MSNKPTLTPKEKEIQSLFVRGKSPETIAVRMGMKLSKVMMVIAMLPKLL
ncbi:helix-turn-helix transcriptional regulator [Prosthecobacter vanneervenii]|uniref:DNA-binding CsgD family transcriptional regulator n=1 Tax=Prosthecobacter vanneervenii TaxID=48466 RepID=A0A7W7YE36_9BACT|nr:helix-turn-helix transcriptional regulator [Prosthecobacter vanneervenii]MBB5034496.1 DNA-binding CsgD family transcriptional regulator [Prosthecobacter vanneervenii]